MDNMNTNAMKITGIMLVCTMVSLIIIMPSYEWIMKIFELEQNKVVEQVVMVGALIVGGWISIFVMMKAKLIVIENKKVVFKTDMKQGKDKK